MKRSLYLLCMFCLAIAMAAPQRVSAQEARQYAVFNYRNDGRFNAFLNHDIDSITFSCIDTLGIEHDDVVVQEVWTTDSLFRIPLDAIDSLAFRAPAPKMRDNIFYLRDYHADNSTGTDSLTIFFTTAIDNDSLPAVGQVVVNVTEKTPFEDGFAGRVTAVNHLGDRIEVVCSQITICDVFERLVTAGVAVSDVDEYKVKRRASRRKGYWDELEKTEVLRGIEVPGEWSVPILNFYTMKSTNPMVECRYFVLVNPWDYYIDADLYIHHNDLSQTITFDWEKIKKMGDEYSKVKKVWDMLSAGDIQGVQDAEAELEEKEWESKCKIPFKAGLFNFSLEFGGFLKPLALNLKWTTTIKSKAFQHIGFTCKGYVTDISYLASTIYNVVTADSWQDAIPPLKHETTGVHRMTLFPAESIESDLKFSGEVSAGVFARFNVSFITKHLVRASVGVEGGVKLTGTIDVKLKDTDYGEPDLYNTLKDTNIDAKVYVKAKAEAGALPFDLIGLSWEREQTILDGKFYFVPSFSQPALPAEMGNQRYLNEMFTSTVSKSLFPLFSCHPGLGIYNSFGTMEAVLTQSEAYGFSWWDFIPQYKPDREVQMSIFNQGLLPGATYRCYPVFYMFGHYWKGGPYTEFTYPKPLTLETPSLILQENVPQLVRISGGWGEYVMSCDHPEVVESELQWLGAYAQLRLTSKTTGTATITVRDRRSCELATLAVKVFGDPEDGTDITLSTTDINFGTLAYGERQTETFTITNHGTKELTYNVKNGPLGFTVEGADEMRFLQPGQSKTFSVTAMGTGPGHWRMGVIYIYSNATKNPVSVGLKVTGEAPQADYVDLGLPSGTKWATFNLGALQTADANAGELIAWGERDSKPSYGWDTYSHCDGTAETCHALGNITGTDNDAAYYQWGGEWRLPTADEMRELMDQCTWTWDATGFHPGYWVKGPNGKSIFLEAAGYAEGTDVKYFNQGGAYMTGTQGVSDVDAAYVMAFDQSGYEVGETLRSMGVSIRPVFGESPTRNGLVVNGDFSLGNVGFVSDYEYVAETGGSALLEEGKYSVGTSPRNYHSRFISHGDHTSGTGNMLIANGSPDNNKYVWQQTVFVEAGETYEFSAWFLSVSDNAPLNKDMIEYSINGLSNLGVYDIAENDWERYYWRYTATETGNIVIKIRTMSSDLGGNDFAIDDVSFMKLGPEALFNCPDNHHPHLVDLGLPSGKKWACCNVGASKPEEYGGYYAWGEVATKNEYSWSTYKWSGDNQNSIIKYCYDSNYGIIDNLTVLELEDDAAYMNLGPQWRMPTKEDQDELRENCDWEWTALNGVNGMKVKSRANGSFIFLPAAGYISGTSPSYVTEYGYYQSSSLDLKNSDDSYYFFFNNGGCYWQDFSTTVGRDVGFSVRAVNAME